MYEWAGIVLQSPFRRGDKIVRSVVIGDGLTPSPRTSWCHMEVAERDPVQMTKPAVLAKHELQLRRRKEQNKPMGTGMAVRGPSHEQ
jgi:hypothetical protein